MALDAIFAAELLLAAFAGGALGAAIGAIPAFSLAGITIVFGQLSPGAGGASPAGLTSVGGAAPLGLGPLLGPHVAFAGGVAATAYAAKKGYVDTGFQYHEAKHVTMALGTKPDVLLVGGVFGVLGHLLAGLSAEFSLPVDPIMASVVVSAFVHRIVLGYPLVGHVSSGLLDMGPFEAGARRSAPAGSESAGSNRLVVEPWLPQQYRWPNVATIGVVAGLFGSFLAVRTGSHTLAFGVAAASLLFLALGMQWMPVFYHVVFPASIVALALPDAPTAVAVVEGAAFGVIAALAAELAQRVLYAHGDTHVDPPAVAIVLTTLLIGVLDIAGVFASTPIPTP